MATQKRKEINIMADKIYKNPLDQADSLNPEDKWGVSNKNDRELLKFHDNVFGDLLERPTTYRKNNFYTHDWEDSYKQSREDIIYNIIERLKELEGYKDHDELKRIFGEEYNKYYGGK